MFRSILILLFTVLMSGCASKIIESYHGSDENHLTCYSSYASCIDKVYTYCGSNGVASYRGAGNNNYIFKCNPSKQETNNKDKPE